jgi:DNA-directed RNA polymerase specialized sigma24 family protein
MPEICPLCNQQYDQNLTNYILSKIPKVQSFDYTSKCITCIKKQSQELKTAQYPQLSSIKNQLDEITSHYKAIQLQWETASKSYQSLDYQEHIIVHEILQLQQLQAKQATKKPSSPATKQSTNKETIIKMLANLSPEQREAILSAMAKKTSVHAE